MVSSLNYMFQMTCVSSFIVVETGGHPKHIFKLKLCVYKSFKNIQLSCVESYFIRMEMS